MLILFFEKFEPIGNSGDSAEFLALQKVLLCDAKIVAFVTPTHLYAICNY